MCSWIAYERPMNDAQEKEKAHRQGGASRTYSWPKPIGNGELVGLIRGPRKTGASKPRERQ